MAEGRLLLRCLWKVGLPLQSKTGNNSHPKTKWGARNLPKFAVLKLILEMGVSGNLWSFLKGVKALVLYDVDRGMVMESMQGTLASSQFDLGYTEQFCIPEVTSVFISSCDSGLGDSLGFNQANQASLHV